jgi:hypothetical protein
MFVAATALFAATFGALLSATLWSTASGAASTSITEPSGHTYHVEFDAGGKPLPVTVVATGFPPGRQVFLEQCNGRAPGEPRWSPTLDCDSGNAPAPAIADLGGTARFSKDDPNRVFAPVLGASPSRLFNCIAPHATPPGNGLTSYTTCQLRVSTNNAQQTDDQVFRSIDFGPGGSGGGSGAAVAVGVIGALIVLGGVIGTVFWLRRRRPAGVPRG